MEQNKQRTFHYTYSAKERDEIKAIRRKYAAPEEADKMTQLRQLDTGVTKKATTAALIVGIIGALLLGSGMSLVMTDLYRSLGLQQAVSVPVGIGAGIVGILLVSFAYPVYNRTAARQRQRIAPQVLRLTEELLK